MYFCNRSVLIRPEHAAGQAEAQFAKTPYAPNTQRETTGCVILHQQYLRSATGRWVLYGNLKSGHQCTTECATACGSRMTGNTVLRKAFIETIGL